MRAFSTFCLEKKNGFKPNEKITPTQILRVATILLMYIFIVYSVTCVCHLKFLIQIFRIYCHKSEKIGKKQRIIISAM